MRAFGPAAVRLLASSWRIQTVHEERWRTLYETGRPVVFVCWHEALLPLLWRHRGQGITLVVSGARDGQYLADLGESLGYRLVRGSSSRGRVRALLGAVRALRAGGTVAFTPDGPRGPRREVKVGAIAAAQRGGGVVVPLHAQAERAWRLASWDRFVIPRPRASVLISYGSTFEVAPGEAGLVAGVTAARSGLEELSEAAA